jgi:hypothetical protein
MTREDVIYQIVERELQGQGLSAGAVMREAAPLHAAACDHFGTWETALRYAGISRRRLRAEEDYSPDRVLRQIRRLCHTGYSLRARQTQRRDRVLYDAAQRHFGGWRQALRAAGIDVTRLGRGSKPRRLDKQAIIAALQERHRAGRSLRSCDVYRENRGLATAAKSAFSSWWRALAAAGLALDIPQNRGRPRRWNKQLVIDTIKTRQREGKRISSNRTRADHPALVDAARRYFGSWAEALNAAAVDPETHAGERLTK